MARALMEALVEVRAARGPDGATRITRCAGGPPLTPRTTGPGVVHLLGTGGGPLPGDRVRVVVDVGPDASLTLGCVAGTVAQRGPDPLALPSRWDFEVTVGPGGALRVPGAPLVAARGCRHEVRAAVRLQGDAELVWCDVLVAGRSRETGGELMSRLVVHRDDEAVLEQELVLDPERLGGHRCVGSKLLAGPDRWRPPRTQALGPRGALMPLAAPGAALATALGDPAEVSRLLAGVGER